MKKFLLFLFSFLFGMGLFILILKAVGWQETKNALSMFRGWQGIAILLLTLLMLLINTLKWQEILKGEKVKISFFNLSRPYLAAFSVMYLAPIFFWAGEFFRAYILKEKYSIDFPKGIASVVIDRISEWTVNLAVIMFGISFFLLMVGLPPRNLVLIFGGIIFLLIIGVFFFYFKISKRESMVKLFLKLFWPKAKNYPDGILEAEKEIFDFFRYSPAAVLKTFSLSFAKVTAAYFRAWLLILFLGKGISGLSVLAVLGFSYLALMIPIPAALGSHEALQIFAFNSLDFSVSAATAFTMIVRGAELLTALAGLIILFRLGIGLISNLTQNNA